MSQKPDRSQRAFRVTHAAAPGPAPGPAQWSIATILETIRWQRAIVIGTIAVALALASLYILITPAGYTATAALVTDTKRAPPALSESNTEPAVDPALIDTHVETLRSEKVALAVIDKLRLYDDPEFVGSPRFFGRFVRLSPAAVREQNRRVALAAFKSRLRVLRLGRSFVAEISFTAL